MHENLVGLVGDYHKSSTDLNVLGFNSGRDVLNLELLTMTAIIISESNEAKVDKLVKTDHLQRLADYLRMEYLQQLSFGVEVTMAHIALKTVWQ